MEVCVSIVMVLAITAGWLLVVSYLDYQVAQRKRSVRRTGLIRQPPLLLEQVLKLPWTEAPWVISGVAVLCLAGFVAILHWSLLLLFGVFGAAFMAILAFLDMKQPQMSATDGTVRQPAWLRGTEGEYLGKAVLLQKPELTIGRGDPNGMALNEPSVSRDHARICWRDGHYYVEDRGSKIGTYVNGQRVERAILTHGHTIRIGSTAFEYRDGTPTMVAGSGQPAAGSARAAAASLFSLRGGQTRQQIPLESAGLTIGRSRHNNLMLADPTVTERHARISYEEGAFFVQDLQSEHGTLVNGRRVGRCILRNGDRITIGASVFEFRTNRTP